MTPRSPHTATPTTSSSDSTRRLRPRSKVCQLMWFDPGTTTGVCIMQIDPRWLDSREYGAGWFGLKAATVFTSHIQLGLHARESGDLGASWLTEMEGRVPPHTLFEGAAAIGGQKLLDEWPEATWGFEDFTVRQINMEPTFLSPARIGFALTMSELDSEGGRAPFVQSSSMAINGVSDARLKEADLYVPGLGHANDAARHCAVFFRRARTDAKLRHLAWPHLFAAPTK